MLHRRGVDASLTLGNKKAVDIVVTYGAGRTMTLDVKGVAGRWDWPADNIRVPSTIGMSWSSSVSRAGFGTPRQFRVCG